MGSLLSRFECPSSSLQTGSLVRGARRVLVVAFAGAVTLHASLARVAVLEPEEKAAKPLTTQFVKRQPRLSKPLELKKRPQPKQRRLERKMVATKAKASRQELGSKVGTVGVVGKLARPDVKVSRLVRFETRSVEPRTLAEVLQGTKEGKDVLDMCLEMVDVNALDTGQYHAIVVQDPTDKRNITGFFHFVRGYSKTMRHSGLPRHNEGEERQVYALKRLASYINRVTHVKTDVSGASVPLDSEGIFKVPWVYLGTRWPFELSSSELQHLGRYLVAGGFLFTEPLLSATPPPADASFRKMFFEALAYEGIRGRAFERIPNSHPIYHCYFDFEDGPPTAYPTHFLEGRPEYDYLEGLFLSGGRLVGIISRKWYANPWGDWGADGFTKHDSFYGRQDPTRPLQFGVNLIVFALTQEGGLTHQLMDSVRY